jgi:integrase
MMMELVPARINHLSTLEAYDLVCYPRRVIDLSRRVNALSIKQVRIGVAIQAFFDALKPSKLAENSIRPKRRSLTALHERARAEGIVYTRDLTVAHFDAVMQDLADGRTPEGIEPPKMGAPRRKRSLTSLKKDRSNLQQFVDFCKKHRWMAWQFDPMYEITRSSREHGDDLEVVKRREVVDHADWLRLLEIAGDKHPRTRILVAMGLFSGRRVSECVALRWEDIDLDARTINVLNQKRGRTFTIVYENTLGYEIHLWRKWLTEQYGAPQPKWHVIPPKVHTRDLRWIGTFRPNCKDFDHRDWPVHVDRIASVGPLIKDIKACLDRLGWESTHKEGVHTLRRSMAAFLDERGHIQEAQALLDHQTMRMTEHYSGNRAGERRLREMMEAGDPFGLGVAAPMTAEVISIVGKRQAKKGKKKTA